jgi:hypothetical protein
MANTFNSTQLAVTTVTTDLYQAPTGTGNVSVVMSCIAANVNGGASADFTLIKTDSANTVQSHIVFTVPVPADTSLECIPNKVVLKAGEKLRASASANVYIQATASVLEITNP